MNDNKSRAPELHRLVRFVGINSVIHPVVTFCISVVIARTLGPDGRGAYGAVVATLAILPIVAAVGLDYSVRFWSAGGQVDDRSLLKTATIAGVLLGALVTGLMLGYVWLGLPNSPLPSGLGDWAIAAFSVSLFLMTLSRFWAEYLIGHERYGYRTWGTTIGALLQLGAMLVAWRFVGLSVDVAVLCLGLQAVFLAVLFLVIARRPLAEAVAVAVLPLSELRKMASYAGWLYVSNLLSQVNLHVTVLMLAALSDLRETGLYTAVIGVANLLLLLGVPLATVISARTTRSADQPDFAHQVAVGIRLVLAVGGAAVLLGAALAPFALPLIFGERFEDSVGPFRLLLPGILGLALIAVISQYLIGAGNTGWVLAMSMVAATVGVVLNLLLVPPYGAAGAAIAVTTGYILALILASYAFLKVSGLRFSELATYRLSDWRPFFRVLLARL